MDYFECDPPPLGDGLCSDNNCPCPEVKIPRGTGYIYIAPGLVAFRRKYPKVTDAWDAMEERIRRKFGSNAGGMIRVGPILVCEQGARLRNLDLETASADARHWWKTAQAPLRPTPLADGSVPAVGEDDYLGGEFVMTFGAGGLFGSPSPAMTQANDDATRCFIATACYGHPNCPEVLFFRRFRDSYMLRSAIGRAFVDTYYAFSPSLARLIRRHSLLRCVVRRAILEPLMIALHKVLPDVHNIRRMPR